MSILELSASVPLVACVNLRAFGVNSLCGTSILKLSVSVHLVVCVNLRAFGVSSLGGVCES